MAEYSGQRYDMMEKFKWMRRFRFFGAAFVFIVYFIVKKINVFHFPLIPFSMLCFSEGILNQPYPFIVKRIKRLDILAYVHMIFDLILISGIIHFLGGIEFSFFSVVYPLIIIYAGIVLSREACYHAAFFSSIAFASIVSLEYFRIIPHIPLFGLRLDALHQFGVVAANILFFYFVATLAGYSTTLLKEKSKKLEEEKIYSENILATMVDGLMVLDVNGIIKDVNKATENILGYSREEIIGHRKIENICKEGKQKKLIDWLKRIRHEGVVKDMQLELLNKEGYEVPVKISASLLKDVGGKTIGIVAILHDATKEREVDRVKNNFVSNITHELLTPLTSIGGFLSLLQAGRAGELNSEQRGYITIIQNQSRHLGGLIESLLDFSRMETGKMQIHEEESSLEVVVDQIISDTKPLLEDKNLTLETHIKQGLPMVSIDKKRIGRALFNILGNAVKFTPRGGKIIVSMREERGFIEVSVADTGIGISKDNLERIFEKFYQIDSSLTRIAGGAGVGLTIAREIIESHGGRILAESEGLGKGSKFTFFIPVA